MIWASDASGSTTYVCPEWAALTGQPASAARTFGWLYAVHPDDREVAEGMFRRANEIHREFWSLYRVKTAAQSYVWVVDGAMPSFGQVNGEFLGFLGSATEVDAPVPPEAGGEFGLFRPPEQRGSTRPLGPLDMMADLTIVARMIAKDAGEGDLAEAYEDVLRELRFRLASPSSRTQ